jgi:DNA-binding transcriptional ArsR family regulator
VSLPRSVNDAVAQRIAAHLKALAQPVRIQLIAELTGGPQTVHELCDAVSTTQQNVSKHLGVLHDAGLVKRQRVGAQVVYSLANPAGVAILEHAAAAVARQAQQLGVIAQALEGRKAANA